MNSEQLKKYYDLILSVGVNLYKGQCLLINGNINNAVQAYGLAEAAYSKGAKFVEVMLGSNELTKHRLEKSVDDEFLFYMPNYSISRMFEQVANDWAYVRFDNLEEFDVLKDVDAGKMSSMIKKEQEALKFMSKSISNSRTAWCIVAWPGPRWAARTLGKEESAETTAEFSDSLARVLRLDKPDPTEAWREHGNKLLQRAAKLTDMKLTGLRFEGPGTDLMISLNKNTFWKGGFTKAQNGRMFIPNIPTEEVFTTPDFRLTQGKVRVTKPVKVMEQQLNGIWFEFKDGKVVNAGAESGGHILEKFLETDAGARMLGEVALVDINSEVHKSGLIYNSILYDENAACHIALGRGIPMCFTNSDELLTHEDMITNGCNDSLVHLDFMIGSPEVSVNGLTEDGKEIPLIRSGAFTV